jgi:hypothetical protein
MRDAHAIGAIGGRHWSYASISLILIADGDKGKKMSILTVILTSLGTEP